MDNGDYVIDVKQGSAPRDAIVAAASTAAATDATASNGVVDVAEVSTTVDPYASHDSVTSAHPDHDEGLSHHEVAALDSGVEDDVTPEAAPADETPHVEGATEPHDTATDTPTDQPE